MKNDERKLETSAVFGTAFGAISSMLKNMYIVHVLCCVLSLAFFSVSNRSTFCPHDIPIPRPFTPPFFHNPLHSHEIDFRKPLPFLFLRVSPPRHSLRGCTQKKKKPREDPEGLAQ